MEPAPPGGWSIARVVILIFSLSRMRGEESG